MTFLKFSSPFRTGSFVHAALGLLCLLLSMGSTRLEAAALVADYRFEGSLKSSVSGAPDAKLEGVSYGSFVNTGELGTTRPVLDIGAGGGLQVDTTGLVDSTNYSAVLLVALSSTGSYTHILDVKDGQETTGWFLLNGAMVFLPDKTDAAPIAQATQFVQLTFVKDGANVRAYANGAKQFDIQDPSNHAQISAGGLIHILRQANGNYAPGGRVARIRLYQGALGDSEVAALDRTAAPAAVPPSGAAVVADYRFESSLKSSVAGAPDLAFEGPSYASFVSDNVFGSNRTVFEFASGGGVKVDSTGLVNRDSYTLVALFELASVASYNRIFDGRDTPDAQGLFVLNGQVYFNPYGGPDGPAIAAQQYAQVVLVDNGLSVRAYLNGVKVLDLVDTLDLGAIGANGIVHFLRQSDAAYAPGGRIARLRVFNGALTDAEVAALNLLVPTTPPPSSGAAVVADYRFENSLKSSVAGAPDLAFEGATYASFVPDNVFGSNRTVFEFASGGGVKVDSTGLVNRDSYTLVALFELASVASYNRIFDGRDTPDAQGLFVLNGQVYFNPYGGPDGPAIAAQQYAQVVLVDNGLSVRAYLNGVKVLDLVDTLDLGAIGANGIVHFLRQSDAAYAPGGRIARLRVFNGALTDAEVAALIPLVPPTNPGPSGGALVADYQFQNNFASSVGGFPPIEPTPLDPPALFVDAPELAGRRVLQFSSGQGLRLATSGLLDTNHFTMVIGFSFDSIGSYTRLLDTKDPTETIGWFLLNGTLGFHPFVFTPSPVISAHEFSEITLVYDAGFARAFVDGAKVIELFDSQQHSAIGTNGVLSFFSQTDGNYAPGGRVTRIRIYNGALTDSEALAVPPSVPRPDLTTIPPGANVALEFKGGFLSVQNADSLKAPFTVEFWAFPTNSGTLGVIGSRQPAETSFDVKFTGNSGVHGDIGNGSSWLTTTADYPFAEPITNWVHVAYVVRTNGYEIVVNGRSVASNIFSGDLPILYDATHQLRIGNSVGGELMEGPLDEIRIWNIARTAPQIAADYRHILRGNETGLVNYYRFSEGHGITTADLALAGGASPATSGGGNTVRWVATGPELDNNSQTDQPDLQVQSIQSPANLVPGQPANLSYTIINSGTSEAVGPWTDAVYLSRDTTLGLDFLVDTFIITNTLAPGATLKVTRPVSIPANGPSGALHFVVNADAGNAIAESNEGNNSAVDATSVTIPGLLTIDLAASQVREDVPTLGASVTRNGDLTAPLTVSLSSSDLTEATVPNPVLIPAGQATVNFLVNVQHDGQLDGPQNVTLTAQATGFQTGTAPLTVLDSDLPKLALSFNPSRLVEGGDSTVTLTREGSTVASTTVNLAGPLGELTFPATILIPAGQPRVVFTVSSVDDSRAQSSRTNLFTAAADGFIFGSAALIVDDNDVPNLRVTLASHTVSESGGPQAASGTVTRDLPSPRPLTVSLVSGNPGAAQVPATVTIPAGETNGFFNVSVTDNTVVDGSRSVAIGAALIDPNTRATLAEAAPDILIITDDDGPSLRLDLALTVVGEGGNPATTGTVTRNTATNTALTVSLTSSATAHATIPASLIIPAGAVSVTFPIVSVADGAKNGNQPVVITATANGFAPAAQTLVVTDADLPDLVITSLKTPASVTSESSFNVTLRIENHGLAASGTNFLQRILLSTDQLPDSDDPVLFENALGGSIPAGLFVEQTFQMRAPNTPGDYYIIAVTDAENRIAEILENNNTRVSAPLHIEKAYRATVTTDVTVAPPNTPVLLQGKATLTLNNAPAQFVTVDLTIRVRGTERHIAGLTDSSGNYKATFQPLPGEGGSYSVSADYPGTTNSPVQATFSLIGLSIDRLPGTLKVIEESSASFSTLIHNLASLPLTQLHSALVSAPPGITASASFTNATLQGDADATLTLNVVAANQAEGGTAVVRVTSAEGATADLSIPITVELARPRLVATPESLEAGMRRGGQTTVQIGITNSGGRATGPLNVLAPAAAWLKVSSGTQIPALVPGAGTIVSLLLTPAPDLDLGPYTGGIVINSTNSSLNVPFTFRNLSDSSGSLLIETVDEYTYYAAGSPKLTNAAVRILDSVSKQVVTTNLTGADGALFLPSLPESYYDLEITADGHSSYKTTLLVEAGKPNQLTAFLSRQTVRYIFSVVPTEIEDRTKIVITTTFEAFVPIPVLTADPVYFDLSGWSGSVTQVNITLMNHGLLAAQNVRFALPEDPDVEFTSLISQIGTLPAQSSITVPVIIRKRDATALAFKSQAQGKTMKAASGGGSCYHDASFDFDLVCGPQVNTYNVPVRFDKLPGCPSGGQVYFETFQVGGVGSSGPGGGPGGFGSCPDCYSGGVPVVFTPPRVTAPPNNCNPCISGIGQAAACIAAVEGPGVAADGITCGIGIASCAAGLASGVNFGSAAGCLSAVGTCISKPVKHPLQIPNCLPPAAACLPAALGGPTSGGPKTASRKSQQLADSAGDQTPPEAAPLIRQLERALAFIAPYTNFLGSDLWLQTGSDEHWTNWFAAFGATIDPASPSAEHISADELGQLLALPLPNDALQPDDLRKFIARWNRSLDYYQRGIFTIAQVPAGESLDFEATDVAASLGTAALAAQDGAVADGYSDPITAVIEASKEFIVKANSAGGGSCAHVKLKIEQEAVITRDAFNATLEISNDTDNTLSDIAIDLVIQSADGADSTQFFAIRPPTLQGLSAVNGTGLIAAHSTGQASWILIPTSDAAPDGPVTHVVGGTLRYQEAGSLITVPLVPSSITVLPNASLSLKYFHQRDVFADDPFTDEIEPSIPYSLAVMIENSGKGAARNLRISSAQPKIVDNQKGLLIDFSIIATEVAGQSLTPSLTANFGDILPGQIKIGRWLLKSTLQGLFTDYSASFENIDGLGDKRISLIQSVEIHEMDHIVQADRTFEDGQPDFLANDIPDFNDYPDTLHLSQGTNMPVLVVTNATIDAPVSLGHLTVALSAAMPVGWGYLRVTEPSDGHFRLKEVRRADNSIVALETNVWITDRTFIGFSQKPVRENILHLLDFQGAGAYRLLYEPLGPIDTTAPLSSVGALPAQVAENIPVSWNGSDGANGAGIAYYDIYVSVNGGAFTPWLPKTTDTGALYPGQIGNTYAFYSVATDFAGNQQTAPSVPNAQTTVNVVNTAPVLTVAPSQTVDEGALVTLVNNAIDNDVPAQTLTWSLGPDAPAGAQIDPFSGLVNWQTSEATGPSTNQLTILVRDNGQPALTATGRVSVIVRELNSPPVLAGTTNRVLDELKTLKYQAQATDGDLPTNSLSFSLVSPPAGASITPAGFFAWTPSRLQGPSTNLIQIKVTDNGIPPLSAIQSFTVIVRDSEGDFDLKADDLVARLAPELSSSLSINSGLDLASISFDLNASSDRLRDVSIEPLIPELGSATLTPAGPASFNVHLVAGAGELLQGNRPIASLTFNTGTNTHSEIVTLYPQNITGTRSSGELVPKARGINGRLVLIGLEPLLEADLGTPVTLRLFGIPDHTYTLEQKPDSSASVAWKPLLQYKQTNLFQPLLINTNAPIMFYHTREN